MFAVMIMVHFQPNLDAEKEVVGNTSGFKFVPFYATVAPKPTSNMS